MFKDLIAIYLLLTRDRKSYFSGNYREDNFKKFEVGVSFDNDKLIADPASSKKLTYRITKNFTPEKETISYFHTRRKFSERSIENLKKHFNVVIFDFLGYADNYHNGLRQDLGRFNIDNILEQSHVIMQDLESNLKSNEYYGNTYKREEKLKCVGRSLGTIIATKFAAQLEKSDKRCAGLIIFVTPVNVYIAIKSLLLRFFQSITITFQNLKTDLKHGFKRINVGTEYESSPAKKQFLMSIEALITLIILTTLTVRFIYCAIKISSNTASKSHRVELAFIASLMIVASITWIILHFDGRESGVTKDDARLLQETPVDIFAVENDINCTMSDLTSYFNPKQQNINIYEILGSKHLTKEETEDPRNDAAQIIQRNNSETQITTLLINDTAKMQDKEIRRNNEKYNEKLRHPPTAHCAFGMQDCAFNCVAKTSLNLK